MPDDTDNRLKTILAWTMLPSVDSEGRVQFDWNWKRWTLAGRIIAGTARRCASSMGSASFRLLRQTRTDTNRKAAQTVVEPVYVGAYVAITAGAVGDVLDGTDGIKASAILWCGWIASYEAELVKSRNDTLGTVQALELGHLLDRMQVDGWARAPRDNAYTDPMQSPPTANIAGVGEQVIGNAVVGQAGSGSTAVDVYLFARKPDDCGTDPENQPTRYWTRWRLLRHLLHVCRPAGLPEFAVIPQDALTEPVDPLVGTGTLAGYLNDIGTGKAEVYPLVEPTYKGQLDLLLPRALGVGWRIDVSATRWTVVPFSHAEDNTYGLPANPTVADVDLTADTNGAQVVLRSNADDLPDRIIVEGGRIVWCGTIGFPDGTAKAGWSTTQLTAWKAAASDADDYASLSTTNKKIRNRAKRHGPGQRDVFTRFAPTSSINGDLQVAAATPGDASSALLAPLVPQLTIDPDGTTVRVTTDGHAAAVSRCPYLPAAALLRTLPWPEGVLTDGTDTRDADSKAQPQYLLPRVFRYLVSDTTNPWRDLLADNGSEQFYPVQVDVDDHGCALRVTAVPVEAIAKSHFSGAAQADIDPTSAANAIDYTTLVFTVALESDQRVRTEIVRPGVTSVRRSLIVRDDRFHLWAVHKGTILGLTSKAKPDRLSVTNDASGLAYLVRNDWPALVRRAKQIASFAFRRRLAVTITSARPDTPPAWAVVGRMVARVIDIAPSLNSDAVGTDFCNTVVEDVSFDFGDAPRVSVTTSIPDAPFVAGGAGGGASASMGGGVSIAGGGTATQQVARVASAAAGARAASLRAPLVPPKGGSASASQISLVIIGGNTLADGVTAGIKYEIGGVTTVPVVYDPNVDTTFIAGIGRADLYIDNVYQGKVLVGNFSGNGGPITTPLVADEIVFGAANVVHIPLVSDATKGNDVYIPASP